MIKTTQHIMFEHNEVMEDLDQRILSEATRRDIITTHYHKTREGEAACNGIKTTCGGLDPVYASNRTLRKKIQWLSEEYPDGSINGMIIT